jgi:hypothetical protein
MADILMDYPGFTYRKWVVSPHSVNTLSFMIMFIEHSTFRPHSVLCTRKELYAKLRKCLVHRSDSWHTLCCSRNYSLFIYPKDSFLCSATECSSLPSHTISLYHCVYEWLQTGVKVKLSLCLTH